MAQEFAAAFYASQAWHKCRAAYIAKAQGLCEDCLASGFYVPGEVVHHRVPLTPLNISDPKISLSFDNLKLVCTACHGKEHAREKRYAVAADGKIIFKTERES